MSARSLRISAALLLAGLVVMCGCQAPQPKGALPAKGSASTGSKQKADPFEKNVQAYAHYAAGLAQDLNGKPEEALAEYIKSLQANPAYEPLLLDVVRRLARGQKYDQAVDLLRTAIAAGVESSPVYGWLGISLSHTGKQELAVEANKLAIAKGPNALGAYQNLSQLYLQLGKTNLALQTLEDASKQKSVDTDFLVNLAEIYTRLGKAKLLTEEDSKKRALDLLTRAIDAPIVAGGLGLAKLGDNLAAVGEYAKAKTVYERLRKDFPDVPMTREKLVNLYLRLGDKPAAIKLLEEIRKDNPTDPQNYFFLGGMAYEQKNFEQAGEYYETALQLNPDFEQLYYDLAGIKITLKKPQEALELLAKARTRFKLNFTMEFFSGIAETVRENYKSAISFFTSAEIVAKATEPSRLTHQFYYQVGSAYERAGQHEEAEKQFRKCLEIKPDYAEGLNYLGYMWADRGEKLDEALPMIEKAVKLEPKNAAFLDSLGWVLFKLNRFDEALPQLQEAIKLNEEPDATLLDHLGDILAALKQFDEAREAWTKSIKVQPSEAIQLKINKLDQTAKPKGSEKSSSSQP